MTRHVHHHDRLSEHLGVRLTPEEKRRLVHLAAEADISVGELVRRLIDEEALRLGITEAPAEKRRGPGRPRKK